MKTEESRESYRQQAPNFRMSHEAMKQNIVVYFVLISLNDYLITKSITIAFKR